MRVCNAGHCAPYRLTADSVCAINLSLCKPVGARLRSQYTSDALLLAPGEALFACTDGVTEAFNAQAVLFGDDRLAAALRTGLRQPVSQIVRQSIAAVRAHADGAAQSDDIAALALRCNAAAPIERYTFDLPAEREVVFQVAAYVDELSLRTRIPNDARADLQVALDEVLSNIAAYAYDAASPNRYVTVEIHTFPTCVIATITDEGVAFNPLTAPRPDTATRLAERKVGGLGIEFMRRLMTTVHYERIENSGVDGRLVGMNRLRLSRMWS